VEAICARQYLAGLGRRGDHDFGTDLVPLIEQLQFANPVFEVDQ
jgi:hypothetical protein